MTVRSCAFISLMFLWPLVQPAFAQTADQVVEKHLAAIGGREALSQLTSRRATGTITITSDAGNLSGPYEVAAKAPNKFRMHMKLDLSHLGAPAPLVVEQKFDGTTGYVLNSLQGDTEITGNQLDNMRNNMFPTPLLTYKAAGATVELLPKEQLAGRDVLVLVVTPRAGSVSRLYLDAETLLVVRSVAKVHAPQMGGEIEQVSEPSDYRTVDGVKIPFKIVTSNALQTLTVTLESVEHNMALDDALFAVKRQ